MGCGRCGGSGWDARNNCRCQCGCSSPCESPDIKIINSASLSGVILVQNSFNMPACNAQATLNVPGSVATVIGGYLWNPTYGYLKIISFDAVLQQYVVENDCQAGNAAHGTVIPAYTPFILTPTPYEGTLTTWAPVLSGAGGMNITGQVTNYANYEIVAEDMVYLDMEMTFTVGGTPSGYIYYNLPVSGYKLLTGLFTLIANDGDGSVLNNAFADLYPSVAQGRIAHDKSGGNWTAGASGLARVSAWYHK